MTPPSPREERGLVTGNAAVDGAGFRGWFVGDLGAWNGMAAGSVLERFGPRATGAVEVKWGVHAAGESRPGGWAEPDGSFALSVLVSGAFEVEFERVDGERLRPVLLEVPGDYVLWEGPAYRHVWRALRDATMLTVRWPA